MFVFYFLIYTHFIIIYKLGWAVEYLFFIVVLPVRFNVICLITGDATGNGGVVSDIYFLMFADLRSV